MGEEGGQGDKISKVPQKVLKHIYETQQNLENRDIFATIYRRAQVRMNAHHGTTRNNFRSLNGEPLVILCKSKRLSRWKEVFLCAERIFVPVEDEGSYPSQTSRLRRSPAVRSALTASSWVAPSKLCPFTSRMRCPSRNRPSRAIAPTR